MCTVSVIKVIKSEKLEQEIPATNSEYLLIDSGAGSGKQFDWNKIEPQKIEKPWFLAGGINIDNIEKAIALNPFAVDISSGAETDGLKDREKILQLVTIARKGSIK
jgi:phosphoribosylanthranilate isomerase